MSKSSKLIDKVGTPVWFPDEEEVWVRGTISRAPSKGKVNVHDEVGRMHTVSQSALQLCHTTSEQEAKMEDLTHLPDLHNPALLSTLHERFAMDRIYTYTGPILLALNPFKPLPRVYGEKIMTKYMNAKVGEKLPPHAYAIADKAFRSMLDSSGNNQSILVSGESGAGKTETTKIIMAYITDLSNKRSTLQTGFGITERVIQANPMMEAFGNAKTIRNDNSSRFGKLIQMQFKPGQHALVGASVDTYLLEKARVVHQGHGERNYHIFYELAAGASREQKKRWRFPKSLEDCHYTNQSGLYRRSDVDDAAQFKATLHAMSVLGISSQDQERLFSIVVAVLHLGNVEFEPVHFPGGEEEGSRVTDETSASADACCRLLQVDRELLDTVLCQREISIGGFGTVGRGGFSIKGFAASMAGAVGAGGELIVKNLNVRQAREARDAMAMTLYERMFGWLIFLVNQSIEDVSDKAEAKKNARGRRFQKAKPKKGEKAEEVIQDNTIGCLDIFGFEVFEHNSFEQLCINYTNETLQQQFNQYMFEIEQKEYQEEGIDWTFISYPDNSACLDMIESRHGLLALIDEQCLYPQGDDAGLAKKLYEQLLPKRDRFLASRDDQLDQKFIIRHFAGDVTYTVAGFCKKNKNELRQDAVDFVRSSKDRLIAQLLPQDAASAAGASDLKTYFQKVSGKQRVFQSSLDRNADRFRSKATSKLQQTTVGSYFKQQLALAMNHIRQSQSHYIRCLKPNDDNVPVDLDRPRLVEQLSYSGVLEVVRLARNGYASRFYLRAFVERFMVLLQSRRQSRRGRSRTPLRVARDAVGLTEQCNKIVKNAKLTYGEDYQIGFSKVFLKPDAFTELELLKAARLKEVVVKLQTAVRRYLARRRYGAMKLVAIRLQAATRGQRARKKLKVKRKEVAKRMEKERQRREKEMKKAKEERRRKEEKRRQEELKLEKEREEQRKREEAERRRNEKADEIRRNIAARKIAGAVKQKQLLNRRQRELVAQSREKAATVLQAVARRIRDQKVAEGMYARKASDMAATTIQALARMVRAKKTREALEEELGRELNEEEEIEFETNGRERSMTVGNVEVSESDMFVVVVLILLVFLLSNPMVLALLIFAAVIFVYGEEIGTALRQGADIMVKAQAQRNKKKTQKKSRKSMRAQPAAYDFSMGAVTTAPLTSSSSGRVPLRSKRSSRKLKKSTSRASNRTSAAPNHFDAPEMISLDDDVFDVDPYPEVKSTRRRKPLNRRFNGFNG